MNLNYWSWTSKTLQKTHDDYDLILNQWKGGFIKSFHRTVKRVVNLELVSCLSKKIVQFMINVTLDREKKIESINLAKNWCRGYSKKLR